jgi:uncharacterized protein YbjT (DUF2867 family)
VTPAGPGDQRNFRDLSQAAPPSGLSCQRDATGVPANSEQTGEAGMKIVVIGGTGLIGSKVVSDLTAHGHQAVAAAPNTGVNTLTGEGLADAVRFAPVLFQPIASEEVAKAVARVSVGAPLNGMTEVAGPQRFRMDEFFRDALALRGDPRTVATDPHARYFGTELGERTLLPGDDATLGEIRFASWPGRYGPGK